MIFLRRCDESTGFLPIYVIQFLAFECERPEPLEKLSMPADGRALTGKYRVRVFRPAWSDVDKWFKRTRDKIEVRSQALKLRFWPDPPLSDEAGRFLDIDWDWIKALPGHNVGELRINDEIGGHKNLRLIFYKGPLVEGVQMPIIWVLAVLPKKRMDWTQANILTFKGRKTLVFERYYRNREFF